MWVHFISKGFGFRKSILKNKQQSHISEWQLIVFEAGYMPWKVCHLKKGYINKFHIEVLIFITFYQDLRNLNGSLYMCWTIFFFLSVAICLSTLLGTVRMKSFPIGIYTAHQEGARIIFLPCILPEAGNASCQRFIE